jgi:hypothetical protein
MRTWTCYGARRLWKLRLDSCRLVDLRARSWAWSAEATYRGDDSLLLLPVWRLHQAFQLVDLSSQRDGYCVAGLSDGGGPVRIPVPEDATLRHGADLVGLARWLAQAERYEETVRLFRRAVAWDV